MARLAEQEANGKTQTLDHTFQPMTTNVSFCASSGSISELMPEIVPKSPTQSTEMTNCDDTRADVVYRADRRSTVSPYPCPPLTPDLSHTISSDISSLSFSQGLLIDTDNKGCNVRQGIKVEPDQEQYVLRNIEAKKAKNLNEISRPAKSESLPHNLCVLQILCQVPVM